MWGRLLICRPREAGLTSPSDALTALHHVETGRAGHPSQRRRLTKDPLATRHGTGMDPFSEQFLEIFH